MTIALVGSAGTVANGGASGSVTPAFAQPTTAGNFCACLVSGQGSSTTNSINGLWNTGPSFTFGFGPQDAAIYYLQGVNNPGSVAAPTISQSGTTALFAQLLEFSGVASSFPIDQSGDSGVTTSPMAISLVNADGTAPCLLLWAIGWVLSKSATCTLTDTATDSGGNSLTVHASDNGSTSTANHYTFGWAVTTTGSGTHDTVNSSNNSSKITGGLGVAASFQPAPPVVPIVPSPNIIQQTALARASNY